MRRPALLDNFQRSSAGSAEIASLPSPVGGWNTRDPVAGLSAFDAVRLTNWFPTLGECQLRGGTTRYAFGMTGTVKSLYQYGTSGSSPKFFAVTDTGVWDITAGGSAGSTVKTLTEGYWNAVNFANSAGTFLIGGNGVDDPVVYNGTTWTSLNSGSTPAITGVTSSTFIWPWLHKRRLFWIPTTGLKVWYFAVDAFAGAAQSFDLGPLFPRGGSLLSGCSWTIDSGAGPDDYWVVVTTEGEAVVYAGTDISDATKWALVGTYFVGKPLGRRCFARLGGDVVILTEQGVFTLSRALGTASVNYKETLSTKIQPTIAASAALYRALRGWEATVVPAKNALIVNVPLTSTTSTQYVMNTVTGAWCDFTAWNASCFAVLDVGLYFGAPSGVVYKAWAGATSDATSAGGATSITAIAQTAFNRLMTANRLLSVNQVRQYMTLLGTAGVGSVGVGWGLAVDYALSAGVSGADSISLAENQQQYRAWRSPVARPGYRFSSTLQVNTSTVSISWTGMDYLVTRGGPRG